VLERGSCIPNDNINAKLLGLLTANWVPPYVRDNLVQPDSLGNRPNILVADVSGGGGMVNGAISHLGARGFWDTLGYPQWNFTHIAPAFDRLRSKLSLMSAPYIPDVSLRFVASGAASAGTFLNPSLNDPSGTPTEGFGNISLASKPSATLGYERDSTLFAYLDPVVGPKVKVSLGSHATRVVFGNGGTARYVEYIQDGIQKRARAKKAVIVSAGAFGSAELLMRSGVGPEDELSALDIDVVSDLPVGRNLVDHHTVATVYLNNCPIPAPDLPSLAFSPGTQVAGFVKSSPERAYPDIQYTLAPLLPGPAPLFGLVTFLVDPETRGNVTLSTSDPLKPSLKWYNQPGTPGDVARIQWAIANAEAFMATGPFAECLGPRVVPAPGTDMPSWIASASAPGYHVTGTNALGSVVDANLEVMGTSRLFVVDGSVLPRPSNANTYIPSALVAERGMDLVLAVADS
jgi:choline dehydrogenase